MGQIKFTWTTVDGVSGSSRGLELMQKRMRGRAGCYLLARLRLRPYSTYLKHGHGKDAPRARDETTVSVYSARQANSTNCLVPQLDFFSANGVQIHAQGGKIRPKTPFACFSHDFLGLNDFLDQILNFICVIWWGIRSKYYRINVYLCACNESDLIQRVLHCACN
jgi:hypothetical protein